MSDVTCNYIECCCPDYLTDHHNRDNELLILCIPSTDRDQVMHDLYESSVDNYLPNDLSDDDLKAAISDMVESLTLEQLCPSYYQQWIDSPIDDDTYNDYYLYAYLSW